jgi:hypothetical protein
VRVFKNKWAMIHLHVISNPFKLLQVCYYISCNKKGHRKQEMSHGFDIMKVRPVHHHACPIAMSKCLQTR